MHSGRNKTAVEKTTKRNKTTPHAAEAETKGHPKGPADKTESLHNEPWHVHSTAGNQ